MTEHTVRSLRRWRYVELSATLGAVVALLATVYLLWTDTMTSGIELLLVAGFAAFLILWYFASAAVRQRLRHIYTQAALHARQEFDSLYAHSPVAYLTTDATGTIKRANPAAVYLLGDTLSDITTRNFYDFVQDPEDDSETILRSKIAAGQTLADLELPFDTIPGETKWMLVNIFKSTRSDERLIELTDITDQRAVDTAKSEFVALATHQLRTPIAAIRWNVELLIRTMRETKTEKQDKYLVKIERNVMRMLNLINDFLSVSKLEMGTFAADLEVVDFGAYLTGILDEFEEKITTKQLAVDYTVTPTELQVAIDRRLFHIVFSNLVSNAVKYTPAGGTVRVAAGAEATTLTLIVADSGIGIPESEQAELFTKFFRASNAQSQVTEGTGLGLYVVKQSVEILGGTLSLQSAENQGTTFTITLPGVVR